jgi:hypothetical protein
MSLDNGLKREIEIARELNGLIACDQRGERDEASVARREAGGARCASMGMVASALSRASQGKRSTTVNDEKNRAFNCNV